MKPDQSAETEDEPSSAASAEVADRRSPAGRQRALMLGSGVLALLLLLGLGLPALLSRPPDDRDASATTGPSMTDPSTTDPSTTGPSMAGPSTTGSAAGPAATSTDVDPNGPEPTRGNPSTTAGTFATSGSGFEPNPQTSSQSVTPTPPQPEPSWVQVWSDEFNGSGLGSAWYVDGYCPHPELVVVSAGIVSVTTADIGCNVDTRTNAEFEPNIAIEYRARGIPPEGYEMWEVGHLELVAASGSDSIGAFIRNGGFHTYRLEWIDGVVHSFVDGTRSGPATAFGWPSGFLRFYVTRPGETESVSRLEIDYIRVYQPA